MKMTIIKAKAALDVDYCASKQIFDDIENSEDYFDVDDLFAIFAISQRWAAKKELELAKLTISAKKTSETFVEVAKLSSIVGLLKGRFVKSFANMLNQRKDDVVPRVRTWLCVYVRFVEELLLLQEFFDLYTKYKEWEEGWGDDVKDSIQLCRDIWCYYDLVVTRLAQLEFKLQ